MIIVKWLLKQTINVKKIMPKNLVTMHMKGTKDQRGWPQKKCEDNRATQSVTRFSQLGHGPEAGLGYNLGSRGIWW